MTARRQCLISANSISRRVYCHPIPSASRHPVRARARSGPRVGVVVSRWPFRIHSPTCERTVAVESETVASNREVACIESVFHRDLPQDDQIRQSNRKLCLNCLLEMRYGRTRKRRSYKMTRRGETTYREGV